MSWIRNTAWISINLAFLDLNPYGNADPDPGAWKLAKIDRWTWFPAFKNGIITYVAVFVTYYLHKVYFHTKIKLNVTAKSDRDPDPHLLRFIRIRIETMRIPSTESWNCCLLKPCGSQALNHGTVVSWIKRINFLIVFVFPAGSWLLHGGVRGVRTKEETHWHQGIPPNISALLKVHKREKFLGSDIEICTFSELVMQKC